MSQHHEWTLSLRLRADTPPDFVDELRFQLGLTAVRPPEASLGYERPVFASGTADALPGGAVATARPPDSRSQPRILGLHVRTLVLDDDLPELIQTVPEWMATWSATQGWIGFAREELGLQPWLHIYVQDRHAYAGAPGDTPVSIVGGLPPFTLTQTTEER